MKTSVLIGAFLGATVLAPLHAGAAVKDGSFLGNSELFLSVVDSGAGVSYFRDLGISFASFVSDPTQTYSFTADANWTAFLATPGVKAADLLYVVAGLNLSAGTTKTYLSTAGNIPKVDDGLGNLVPDPDFFPTTSLLGNGLPTVNSYVTANAGLSDPKNLSTHGTQANGSNLAFSGDGGGFAYFGDGFGPNWGGNTPFDATQAIGKEAEFYFLSKGPTAISKAKGTLEPNVWLLKDDGSLTYGAASVPVPEPGTWELLAAGGAIAVVLARRRARRSN